MYDFECSIVSHVVVVLQALVAGEPDRDRLVAAVHRHQVDVHVDDQVGLGGPLRDLDVLALRRSCRCAVRPSRVLGVEVVQLAPARTSGTRARRRCAGSPPAVIRRCSAVATISSTSSTPLRAASSITCSRIRWRMSGVRIGGSGIEMSSIAIVSFMPGEQQLGKRLRVADGVQQRVTDRRRARPGCPGSGSGG